MTFATFTSPSGLQRLVTPDYVVAVQSTAGDAVSRVWTVADSAPGASRGYFIVTGTFAATVAAVGAGLVTLALPDGGQIALNPQWVTQLEQLPGDTATRVVWAADSEGGYATVLGDLATIQAALTYTPPTPVAPGGVTSSVQVNDGAGQLSGDANFLYDLAAQDITSTVNTIDLAAANTAVFRSLLGTVGIEAAGQIDLVAAQGITLNSSTGTAGQVLTSGGPNLPSTWTTVAGGAATIANVALSAAHNNASPLVCGGFFAAGQTTTGVRALIYSANTTRAEVRVLNQAGTPLLTVTEAPAGAFGWREISASTSVVLPTAGVYIDLAHLSGSGLTYVYAVEVT